MLYGLDEIKDRNFKIVSFSKLLLMSLSSDVQIYLKLKLQHFNIQKL